MNALEGGLIGLSIVAFAGSAWGQDYPNKPIRFVVPYPPGGTTDIVARIVGLKMGESWGQQVVPCKGAAPAMTDLIGGQVHLMFDFMSSSLPQIKAGKIRALGVTTAKRSPTLPEVPTIAEAGLPGYEVQGYFGVLVPAATPREIITRLNQEIARIAQQPDVRERFAREGIEPDNHTPAQFAAYLKAEVVKWAKVVKASGVRVD